MPMRQPTKDPMRWWRFALMDPRTPRHDGEPQAGFYVRRAVKGGPLLPVEVRLVQEVDPDTGELTADERFEAEELGWEKDPYRLWTHLRPVTREEFDALVELHRVEHRMSEVREVFDVSAAPMRPTRGESYA